MSKTIHVSRKISDGNYGSAEASIEVQIDDDTKVEDAYDKAYSIVTAAIKAELNGSTGAPSVDRTTPEPTSVGDVAEAYGIEDPMPGTEASDEVDGAAEAAIEEVFGTTEGALDKDSIGAMNPEQFAAFYNSLGDGGAKRTADQVKAALIRLQTNEPEFWDNRPKLKSNGGTWSDKSPHFSWGKGKSEEAADTCEPNVAIWPKR